MNEIILYTDGSVNNQLKIGYGAYLIVREDDSTIIDLKARVKVKCFENTSSTKLEIQTILWALNELSPINQKVILYTDSQNMIGLIARRAKLEKDNYSSKKNSLIKNHLEYKKFFKLTDRIDIEFIKIKGHQSAAQKSDVDKIFALVDKASRLALRNHLK
ncbi:MAG: ribonuclease HI [Prolixibacteraceae bacterium]